MAIAHDYLTQRGGAEKVVLALARAFPGAPIYTTLYQPDTTYPEFRELDVRVSSANKIGVLRKHHRMALPLLAFIASSIKIDADVVISSSSGWAHGFRTDGNKLVYCYSPARWLYQRETYLGAEGNRFARLTLALIHRPLKMWDRRAARHATKYLAISSAVQRRIDATYGLDSEVVPAPHTIDNTLEKQPVASVADAPFYLCISRLLPYKNVDKVIQAFNGTDRRLVVVGTGPCEGALKELAQENIVFVKGLTDAQIRWLYSRCSGLVAASYEDFGLTPLEACTFGKPSAVLRWGGFLDTLKENETGVYFDQPDPDLIRAAVDRLESRSWDYAEMLQHVDLFSEKRFADKIDNVVSGLFKGRPAGTGNETGPAQ